jgi:hypothetical protein
MNATRYCVRNAMGDGSRFARSSASENRYRARNTFGRSALLVV